MKEMNNGSEGNLCMKNTGFKKGILTIMILSAILSLVGCGSKGAGVAEASGGVGTVGSADGREIVSFAFSVSGYNPGYYYRIEDGKEIYANLDEGQKEKKHKVDKEKLAVLLNTFEKLDIYSWDGYKESNDEMLDGTGFMLYATFSDGTVINASGSNCFPENFEEFESVILSLIK